MKQIMTIRQVGSFVLVALLMLSQHPACASEMQSDGAGYDSSSVTRPLLAQAAGSDDRKRPVSAADEKAAKYLQEWRAERERRIKLTPEDRKLESKAREEEARRVAEEYESAGDSAAKLHVLLKHSNSKNDWVLRFIAKKIKNHYDPRSIEVLKRLRTHRQHEDHDSSFGSIPNVANDVLEDFESREDMAKLSTNIPVKEKEAIIRKYVFVNAHASAAMASTILPKEIEKDPATYVPLLVHYLPYMPSAQKIAEQYPEHADKGLERCLEDTNATFVASCVGLIGALKKEKYLQRIFDVAYDGKGNYDPSQANTVRHEADLAYFYFGPKAVPYLEKILYSNSASYIDKRNALGKISHFGASESKLILSRFRAHYSASAAAKRELIEEIDRALSATEGSRQ